MAYTFNPSTNRLEDENGQPAPDEGVAMDQIAGAPPPAAPPAAPKGAPITLDPNEGTPLADLQRQAARKPPETPSIQRPDGTARGSSPAAPGPTITTHVGGVSMEQPIGPGGVTQKTSGGTTTTRTMQTPGEKKLEAKQDEIDAETLRNAEAAKVAGHTRAITEAAAADKAAELAQQRNEQTQAAMDMANKEIATRQAIVDKNDSDWQKAALESTESRNTFWARQSTGMKVRSGISLILGIVGGMTDGSNVGAQYINKAIDQDAEDFKQRAANKLAILEKSKGNVEEARKRLKDQIDQIEIRKAAALDAAATQAEANGRRLGIDESEIKGNQGILDLRAAANDKRMKYQQDLRTKVTSESARTITTGAEGMSGGADKPAQKWSGDEKKAEGFAQRMAKASEDMDRYSYTPDDLSVLKNQTAIESVGGKKGTAVNDWLRGNVFQRLSPEGKKRFLAEQEFARANLRRESGAAIGLAEQEQEIEGVGARPGDTPETLAQKRAQRMNKIGAVGISSGRPDFWQKQVQQMGGGGAPAGATPDRARLERALVRARAANDQAAVQELEAALR